MTKTITLSLLAASFVFGLGGSALAATNHEHEGRQAALRASRLDVDPAGPPFPAGLGCSIKGNYHDQPYCFGGEANAGELYRPAARRAERFEPRAGY